MSAAPIIMLTILIGSMAMPSAGVMVCALILFAQTGIIVVRLIVSRADSLSPSPTQHISDHITDPVFSVHVAIHNEPPSLVIATLRALHQQDWPTLNYEVIVIDNNTEDPALWLPVRAACEEFGPSYQFIHEMGVRDAKAGALNIALSKTWADATHIVTVDADYQVSPDFLTQAARALQKTGADYVQFPQAYRGCQTNAAGVDSELEEYFLTTAQLADGSDAVLLTGTLCVISRAVLEATGGWPGLSTTEDAEMGVRLCRAGYSGRFIPMVVGRGLLPFSLRDLAKQRYRWASGNLQTLIAHASAILFGSDGMGWRRRGAILSQLTAWLNFVLIPTAILVVALVLQKAAPLLLNVAAACVVLAFADIVVRLVWQGWRDGTPLAVIAAAITHRVALAPISAIATIEVFAGKSMSFVVTDKFGKARGHCKDWPVAATVLFGAACVALIPAFAVGGLPLAAVVILFLPLPAAIATALTLDRYRQSHVKLTRGVSA